MDSPSPFETLHPRERQILDAKCLGLQRQEIALTLRISIGTYDSYLQRAKARGQCITTGELISKYTAWKMSQPDR